jgi:hypothetical protein
MVAKAVVEHITRKAEWKGVWYSTGMDHASGYYAHFFCGCEHDMRGQAPVDGGWLLCPFHQGMEEVSRGADLESDPVLGGQG